MTEYELTEFYAWARKQIAPAGFDVEAAIANSLGNTFDAEDKPACARSTFACYIDQGVSFFN
jgi:hypothetical protein